jgi:hypothetical protein
MYVREEVVYQGVQGRKRAYLLSGELGWMGRLQRMGGMGRRLRRRPRSLYISNSSLLYGFCMLIGWTASSTWAVEGTRYLEPYTGFAWRSGLIALGMGQQLSTNTRLLAGSPLLCVCCTNRRLCAGGWASTPVVTADSRHDLRGGLVAPEVPRRRSLARKLRVVADRLGAAHWWDRTCIAVRATWS